MYFDANKAENAINMGYLKFFTKLENLRAMAFIADLLQIYSRYQKKIQSDQLTLIGLAQCIRSIENVLIGLKTKCLVGGWEETLKLELQTKDEKTFLKKFELWNFSGRRGAADSEFDTTRNEIVDVIIDRLQNRFEIDNVLMESIEPFVMFSKDADVRKVHEKFATDLDLSALQRQYDELCEQKISMKLGADIGKFIQGFIQNLMSTNYIEITTILSRI